jgi:hypothetical protein
MQPNKQLSTLFCHGIKGFLGAKKRPITAFRQHPEIDGMFLPAAEVSQRCPRYYAIGKNGTVAASREVCRGGFCSQRESWRLQVAQCPNAPGDGALEW